MFYDFESNITLSYFQSIKGGNICVHNELEAIVYAPGTSRYVFVQVQDKMALGLHEISVKYIKENHISTSYH